MDGLCKRSGREAVALSAILAITSMVAPVFTTAASAAKGGGAGLALTVVADATQVSPGQPVGFAVTVPAQALTARLHGGTFALAAGFAAVLFAFTRWFWRFGLRRYSGASA